MNKRDAIEEICKIANEHGLDVHMTSDRIPAEDTIGPDGTVYRNFTPGDLHVRIDLPASV